MFDKKTIDDVDVTGKTVLMRVDYNLPQNDAGEVTDTLRIRESLGTIRSLFDKGAAKVVLMAHLGRPDGEWKEKYTLLPVFEKLAEMVDGAVFEGRNLESETEAIRERIDGLERGSVVLLENIRFYGAEELKGKTDEERERRLEWARRIVAATGAEVFVCDCFGVAHRDHVSISGMNEVLPGVAGLLVKSEVEKITGVMRDPKRPLLAIIGGAKISDKIGVMKRLVELADVIVVGGAMANTFLRYKGVMVGRSVVEEGQDEVIREVLELAENLGKRVILPSDVVVGELRADSWSEVRGIDRVGAEEMILDVGPMTRGEVVELLQSVKTVIWNGTLGMTEYAQFAEGSREVMRAILANKELVTVIGGGDTGGFAEEYKKAHGEEFTGSNLHISTGGGASLELIEGKSLPGVEALQGR